MCSLLSISHRIAVCSKVTNLNGFSSALEPHWLQLVKRTFKLGTHSTRPMTIERPALCINKCLVDETKVYEISRIAS